MTIDEAKKVQKELGRFLGFYYGTNLYPCCSVYPKLEHTKDFADLCYWKCPVCGREKAKYQMPWLASKDWQKQKKPHKQMTIEEWITQLKEDQHDTL